MSAETDPEPIVNDEGEIAGYQCPECGGHCFNEQKALVHCADESESEPEPEPEPEQAADSDDGGREYISDPEFTGDEEAVREHYRRAQPVYDALADVDGHLTSAAAGDTGWYTYDYDLTDIDDLEAGWDARGRPITFGADDHETLLEKFSGENGEVNRWRVLYNIASWKDAGAMDTALLRRFDSGDEDKWEGGSTNPLPGFADMQALGLWVDLDLHDDLKDERGDLDAETLESIERAQQAYCGEVAALYGTDPADIPALDSGGGGYVYGPPEATLSIAAHYTQSWPHSKVFGELADRLNAYGEGDDSDGGYGFEGIDNRVIERVPEAADLLDPDWMQNPNRKSKAPLSIHHKHDIVVTPLRDAGGEIDYSPTLISDVDDDLIERTAAWAEQLTAAEHTDTTDTLISNLWPEYADEYGGWQEILDAWLDDERDRLHASALDEYEQEKRREKLADELGDGVSAADEEVSAALAGQAVTTNKQDRHDAVDRIDVETVIKDHASDSWDTSNRANETTFDPSWRTSDSGKSCAVTNGANSFVDNKGGGGGPVKAYALGEEILPQNDGAAAMDLEGERLEQALNGLRSEGYSIPAVVAEPGDEGPDGEEYEKMPFWSVRKAAVALNDFPADGFVEKTSDDGGTYPGFPGPGSYNNALDAIEEAGLDHNRERADEGPVYPVYELLEDDESVDLELHLRPITGKKAEIAIMRDGHEAYSETQERGFWHSGTKRSRVAGRVKDEIQAVDPETLSESVKHVLVEVTSDSKADWFEKAMRSDTERELRERTTNVVCWPGEEETEWVVTMLPPVDSPESEPQTFNFDNGQITNADPGYFRSLHTGAFFEKVDIDAEEWANITSHWLDIQETKGREADPRKEAAIEGFLSKIEVMTVWAEQDGFDWGGRNGLYQPDHADGNDAILVPGRWVMDWLNDSDYADLNFSKILRERGVMVHEAKKKQINGQQNRAWPIAAEKTGHTYENSHRPRDSDDDDAPEGLR